VITHVVLFSPHAAIGAPQKAEILASLHRAVEQCGSVRASRIGRRVRHGLPGYEQQMGEDFQYIFELDFDDLDGLRVYLEHPAHGAISGFFTSAASASLAYDYEVVELRDANRMLG
jgi:hypothetical protein